MNGRQLSALGRSFLQGRLSKDEKAEIKEDDIIVTIVRPIEKSNSVPTAAADEDGAVVVTTLPVTLGVKAAITESTTSLTVWRARACTRSAAGHVGRTGAAGSAASLSGGKATEKVTLRRPIARAIMSSKICLGPYAVTSE